MRFVELSLKLKPILVFSFLLITFLFLAVQRTYAHCPLCVAGAGVGLSLSRVLGIDDTITGVWIAAVLGASALWLSNMIKKRYVPFQELVIYLFVLVTTVISFYRFGLINEHNGLLLNLPKLTLGIIVGGVGFWLADKLSGLIRKQRGKVLFPYQGVVVPLGAMTVLSVGFYVLLNYFI